MSFVNYKSKEINCKVAYCGIGMSGKTTSIKYIYQNTNKDFKRKLVNLDADNDRTIFFDFLPLELGEVKGFKTRFHLYTVPGQAFYEASKKLILRGVDGIIFVADSQVDKMEANIESMNDLKKSLDDQDYDIESLPIIFQWNKRDLPNIVSVSELSSNLNHWGFDEFESTATTGKGVFETLESISKKVLHNIRGGFKVPSGLN